MKNTDKKSGANNKVSLLLALLVIISSVIQLLLPSLSFALSATEVDFSQSPKLSLSSGKGRAFTPSEQALSAEYFVTLERCFNWGIRNPGTITPAQGSDIANPAPSIWFNDTKNAKAYINGLPTTCASVATQALALWGWATDYASFLTTSGCAYNSLDKYICATDGNTRSTNFRKAVLDKVYSGIDAAIKNKLSTNKNIDDSGITLTDSAKYQMFLSTFNNKCSPQIISNPDDPTEKSRTDLNYFYPKSSNTATIVYTKIKIVDPSTGLFPETAYTYQTDAGVIIGSNVISNKTTYSKDGFETSLSNKSGLIESSSVNIFGHVSTQTNNVDTGNGLPVIESCTYIKNQINSFAQSYSDFAKAYTQITGTVDKPNTPTPPVVTTTSCSVGGIGWIVCPVINFLAGIADTAFNFLADNFLSVNTLLLNTDPKATDSSGNAIGTGAYTAWQMMRSFANVVLVIVFLVIIFSQLSSVGITNYGIKKLLPKLVLIAVLINVSFFICQISVDLSNILGYNLKSLLTNLAGSAVNVPDAAKLATASATGSGWSGIAGTVLAGGTAAGLGVASTGGITLAFVALVGMLLAAVIALLMIFFILVVRQMLVVLLVVMVPLAFAAYLLPNTKNWFEKWGKLFTQILMLFPIIGVIFGGSTLVSVILKSAFAGSGSVLAQIVAAGVLALPLFLVPTVLKGALNGIGTIGAKISGLGSQWGSAVNRGVRNKYTNSDYNKFNQTKKAENKARIAAGNYRGRGGWINPRNIRSRANAGLNNNRVFNAVTGGFGASQFLSSQGQNRKDMADAISMFNGDDDLIEAWAATGGNIAAARTRVGSSGDRLNLTQIQQMQRMRDAGHHRKATSFLAAASAMSTEGKGSTVAIASALGNAARAGASATDTDGAWQAALSAYRTSGRGDIVGEMSAHMTANGGVTPLGIGRLTATPADIAVSRLTSWGQVSASSVHRNAIDPTINYDGAVSYQTFLENAAENTRQSLAGYDQMEARTKVLAQPDIIAAAQLHELNDIAGATAAAVAAGLPPPTTAATITNIQTAKTYFGIR